MPYLTISEAQSLSFHTNYIRALSEREFHSIFLYLFESETIKEAPIQALIEGTSDPLLFGKGILNFAFLSCHSNYSIIRQTRIFQNAALSFDVPAYNKGDSILIEEKPIIKQFSIPIQEKMLTLGSLFYHVDTKELSAFSKENNCIYTNLCEYNAYILKSTLIGAIKYAYECEYGKSLSPFIQPQDLQKEA